jgi:hypothetical protein
LSQSYNVICQERFTISLLKRFRFEQN